MPADLAAALAELLGTGAGYPATPDDVPWTCAPCGAVLGLVNRETGTMRRRADGGPLFVALGAGGRITLTCPRCCEVNTLTGEEITALSAG